MLSIAQRQRDRAVEPMRFIYRQNHFQSRTSIVHIAFRLDACLDGVDQIKGNQAITEALVGVRQRFRLVHPR